MTELRKRMIECLQLKGLSERTQESYVRAVRQLAEHYHKAPDLITEEELRQYFLFLKNVKHYSRSTSTIAICGIRFFFAQTLNRDWSLFGLLRAPREKKLPVILSREEVRQILGRIKLPRYQVCLTTFTSATVKARKTAMSHCRNARWSCCASIGSSIAIRCCSFPQKAVTISTWRGPTSRCPRAACKTLSMQP